MPQYGECEYWDERYSREPAAFDWYQGFSGLVAILQQIFPVHASLLQIGVGSSRLQEDMARAGWRRIVNIDYSKVVIAHMAELHRGIPALEYRVADVRHMPEFADGSFDGVLDKGTLDAVLCGEKSTVNAAAMVAECYRVLRPGGAFMLITYGDPASRLPYLDEIPGWSIAVYALTKQELVEALDAEPVVRPLIKGPYPASNLDCMDALSGLEGMHFVYICRKTDAEDGPSAAAPQPAPQTSGPQPQPQPPSPSPSGLQTPYRLPDVYVQPPQTQASLEAAGPGPEDLHRSASSSPAKSGQPEVPLGLEERGSLLSAGGLGLPREESSDVGEEDAGGAGEGEGASTDPETPEDGDGDGEAPQGTAAPLAA